MKHKLFVSCFYVGLCFLFLAKADSLNNINNYEVFTSSKQLNLIQGSFIAWHQQCLKKNYDSCGLVGRAYYEGYGVLPNATQAQKYFQVACNNGVVESCLYLGNFVQNKEYDILIYKQACELGHFSSCDKVKGILLDSITKDSDDDKKQQVYEALQRICDIKKEDTCIMAREFAAKFMDNDKDILQNLFQDRLKQCKEKQEGNDENLHICGDVGLMYANGLGIDKNKEEAKKYFHIVCLKHKQFCRNEILDSILN